MSEIQTLDPELLAHASPQELAAYEQDLIKQKALLSPLDYLMYTDPTAKPYKHTELLSRYAKALVEHALYKDGPGTPAVWTPDPDDPGDGAWRHPETGEEAQRILVISCPPQIGKSTVITKTLPAWYLTKFPDRHVILTAYGAELAEGFSTENRDKIEQSPELGVHLHSRVQSAKNWRIADHKGELIAAGSGGPITGREADVICVLEGTQVETPIGSVDISTLARDGGRLWAYDHDNERIAESRVTAAAESVTPSIVEVHMRSGRILRCTPDHRIYVHGHGYVEAELVQEGAEVSVTGGVHLPGVQHGHDDGRSGIRQATSEGQDSAVLLAPMSRDFSDANVPGVRSTDGQEDLEVLPSLSGGAASEATGSEDADLRGVRRVVPSGEPEDSTVQQDVCCGPALSQDAWKDEPELQGWEVLQPVVQVDASADLGTGRRVCRVWDHRESAGASHQRDARGQRAGEPYHVVPSAPSDAPQVQRDTVSLVVHRSDGPYRVYDLTVDRYHNFFADEVLVHNCIDDPVKTQDDALSEAQRRKNKNWWESVVKSRIRTDTVVILIQTRWHEDDLAGYVQETERCYGLNIPAIAFDEVDDDGISVDPDTGARDPLGRRPGEVVCPELQTRSLYIEKRDGPGSKDNPGGVQWFSALYQGKPNIEGGGILPKPYRYYTTETNFSGRQYYRTRDSHKRHRESYVNECIYFITADLAASKQTTADYTVFSLFAWTPFNQLLLVDMLRERMDSTEHNRKAEAFWQKARRLSGGAGVRYFGVEHKSFGLNLIQGLRKYAKIPVKSLKAEGDKIARAIPVGMMIREDAFFLPAEHEILSDLEHEMQQFPNGRHDDMVDTLGYGASEAALLPRRPLPEEQEQDSHPEQVEKANKRRRRWHPVIGRAW